jgi:sec-independent protein translocase protein TatA
VSLGPWQLLIIALVILLLFGGSRLADIGKGLGEGIRALKKGLSDDEKKPGSDQQAEEPGPPKQLPSSSAPAEDRARAPEEETSHKRT